MIASAQRYGPYIAASLVAFGMVLLASAALYNLNHQRGVDRQICESTVENRAALRLVFETSRDIFKEQSENPQVIDLIFDRILRPIPVLECRDNQPVPKEG